MLLALSPALESTVCRRGHSVMQHRTSISRFLLAVECYTTLLSFGAAGAMGILFSILRYVRVNIPAELSSPVRAACPQHHSAGTLHTWLCSHGLRSQGEVGSQEGSHSPFMHPSRLYLQWVSMSDTTVQFPRSTPMSCSVLYYQGLFSS